MHLDVKMKHHWRASESKCKAYPEVVQCKSVSDLHNNIHQLGIAIPEQFYNPGIAIPKSRNPGISRDPGILRKHEKFQYILIIFIPSSLRLYIH